MALKKLIMSVSCVVISGCASIVSTSEYPVKIDSSVSGATVSIKDKYGAEVQKVTTPAMITLSSGGGWKSASYMFEFEKEGYESSTESIVAEINPWYMGNIIFGGLVGMILVDPATGAMWKLKDHVHAQMYEKRNYGKVSASINTPIKGTTVSPASVQQNFSNNAAPSVQNLDDISGQLKKLKELKDLGVLTNN